MTGDARDASGDDDGATERPRQRCEHLADVAAGAEVRERPAARRTGTDRVEGAE